MPILTWMGAAGRARVDDSEKSLRCGRFLLESFKNKDAGDQVRRLELQRPQATASRPFPTRLPNRGDGSGSCQIKFTTELGDSDSACLELSGLSNRINGR